MLETRLSDPHPLKVRINSSSILISTSRRPELSRSSSAFRFLIKSPRFLRCKLGSISRFRGFTTPRHQMCSIFTGALCFWSLERIKSKGHPRKLKACIVPRRRLLLQEKCLASWTFLDGPGISGLQLAEGNWYLLFEFFLFSFAFLFFSFYELSASHDYVSLRRRSRETFLRFRIYGFKGLFFFVSGVVSFTFFARAAIYCIFFLLSLFVLLLLSSTVYLDRFSSLEFGGKGMGLIFLFIRVQKAVCSKLSGEGFVDFCFLWSLLCWDILSWAVNRLCFTFFCFETGFFFYSARCWWCLLFEILCVCCWIGWTNRTAGAMARTGVSWKM